MSQVLAALDGLRNAVDALPDTAARVAMLSLAITAVDGVVDELGRIRLGGISELRAGGWSYQRIAQRSGLSKARVAQLARAAAKLS